MARKQDLRRRAIGAFFLIAAVAMLAVGETFLRDRLRSNPTYFALFWMICVVLLGLAVLVAILDLAVVRRRLQDEQRELLENTLRQIEQEKSKHPPPGERT
jgi:uncharacterized membrane protein YhaH (DUF805 family)